MRGVCLHFLGGQYGDIAFAKEGNGDSTATFSVQAAGEGYKYVCGFVYPREIFNDDADLFVEVNGCIRNAWCSFWKYTLEAVEQTEYLVLV